jgi:hypothetical protein
MAVIWGLDLKEIQWAKFKSSYMFNKAYHLRSEKMIVYQIAMVLCVVSESVGTAALSGRSLALVYPQGMLTAVCVQITLISKMGSQLAVMAKLRSTTTTSLASLPSTSSSE